MLLEKNEKCGKKLLLTGGKRCNVTNRLLVKEFIDTLTFKHKRFLYPALKTFGRDEVISFFKIRDLEFVLENNFKYFPKTEKSLSVLEALTKDLKSSTKNDRIFASPLARRIAKNNNIDLNSVKGTGPRGRIIKADLENIKNNPALIKNNKDL